MPRDMRVGGGPYGGKQAALATMHGKERAFAPPFRRILNLELLVPANLDTDALGTFSGEVPRRGTMMEAALAKVRMGMAASGLPIGLASEGAYGPHPRIPFLHGGVELAVLVDEERS